MYIARLSVNSRLRNSKRWTVNAICPFKKVARDSRSHMNVLNFCLGGVKAGERSVDLCLVGAV